jgi:DNA-binding sugar fermentation-stimulating protein
MELLYKFSQPFIGATVTSRPSRTNKSPYLVDCRLDGAAVDAVDVIVHNPALKCNGLVEPGARVYLQPAASTKSLSKYVLYLVEAEGELICIHPTIANKICEGLIRTGRVARGIAALKAESTHGDCRFDFSGQLRGRQTFIEVKAAPIADHVNCLPRDRARALKGLETDKPKMAIFPFGNKQKEGLVSERALKHVQGLEAAVKEGHIGYLVYISMRSDVDRLKVSELDAEYRTAVMRAAERGVFVRGFSVRWTADGECYFGRALEVI